MLRNGGTYSEGGWACKIGNQGGGGVVLLNMYVYRVRREYTAAPIVEGRSSK